MLLRKPKLSERVDDANAVAASKAVTAALPRPQIPWRPILIGCALLPINAIWLVHMEMSSSGSLKGVNYNGPYPTNIGLFANVIFLLVLLSAINAGVRRFRARWALTQNELLLLYVMLSIGTSLTSCDFLDVLLPMLGHPTRYATLANGWQSLFVRYLPTWFFVRDKAALDPWYVGRDTLFTAAHLHAWAGPLLTWGGFILTLLWVMLCLNTLLRIPWTRHERLSYPIIQLPMELTDPTGKFFQQPLLWAGFAVAAGISLLNGLNMLFPSLPSLPIKGTELSTLFTDKPWNAMGWTPVNFYPFAIGLGFLLPVDMLFSTWFFCLMWRGQRIVSSLFGWGKYSPTFPYVNEQSFGAYMGVALVAAWGLRRHLAMVVREAWKRAPEADQPMSYRLALVGAGGGFCLLVAFFWFAGLPLWACILSFLIYFATALACTRMRAELGPPAHDMHNGGPDYILTEVFGSRAFTPQALGVLTYFYWFNRAYRTIAMPYQLEAFKLADQRGISMRGVTFAIGIASVVGLISGFWAFLTYGYHYGAETHMAAHFTGFGTEAFTRLANWIQNPRYTDVPAALAIVLGLAFTLFLYAMRMRFPWWPFHPLGLAISGSFSMSTMWVCMLIAWVCKVCLFHYGGLASYRKALPFFYGLILGDFLVGCLWPLAGWILGVNTYSFYF